MDLVQWLRAQWDRAGAWLLVILGALALILGWVGVSGNPYTDQQLPYIISGGLGGIFLLGLGAMLWMSADLSDEWRKLDEVALALNRIASTQHSPGNGRDHDWSAETAVGVTEVGDHPPTVPNLQLQELVRLLDINGVAAEDSDDRPAEGLVGALDGERRRQRANDPTLLGGAEKIGPEKTPRRRTQSNRGPAEAKSRRPRAAQ